MNDRKHREKLLVVLVLAVGGLPAAAQQESFDRAQSVARAKYLWSQSPHGKMLERILPPAIEPAQLPEPRSEGAQLAARYCVQCHYLPNPQMHTPDRWKITVERMVWRMQGRGNMGQLMKDMMDNVEAPAGKQVAALIAYLQKHGQREIDPAHPALRSESGQIFSIACSQCHAAPDPGRHTAREWPGVVERMKRHMAWANVVVGADDLKTNPVLNTGEIVRFLQRYARAEPKAN
jgi:mono/diheme cytochrome c family protein